MVKGAVPLRERGLVGPHAAPDNSRRSEEGTVKEQLKSFQGWNFLKLRSPCSWDFGMGMPAEALLYRSVFLFAASARPPASLA